MRFTDIQHQDRAIAVLRRGLQSGRAHHAYLLEGPEGVGKELTGRALAASLLCVEGTRSPGDEPCGSCTACKLFAAGNHPDFHLIERGLRKHHPDRAIRASKGLFLVVDLIRHFVIEPAGLKPTQGSRRVFLVRDAERMNEEAQNALLKTLEEPPESVCLILVTASASRLLPTIRSRCQRVAFDLLPPAFVAAQLRERSGLDAAAAGALAELADGRLGVALRWHHIGLLEQVDPLLRAVADLPQTGVEEFSKTLVDAARQVAAASMRLGDEAEPDDQDDITRSAVKNVPTDVLRDGLKLVLMLVAAVWRDALLAASGAGELRWLAGEAQHVDRLAAGKRFEELEHMLAAVAEAERMLDRNVNPQLAGERLGVALLGEVPVG